MSCRATYSREDLQRISDRKKRKLAIDDSDKISVDPDVDSQLEVIDDSQSPLTGYRDLFGELIPTSTCKPATNDKLIQKKVRSRKKKHEESFKISPRRNPTSIFIPTPRIIRIMKEAQSELYSLMGLNKSSSDVSNVSTDSLNVSGIQQLPSSPIPKSQKVSNTDLKINENNKELPQVLKGVIGFVDYKVNNDRSGIGIIHRLKQLGASVEKSFNLKVTHVIFRDGYRKTYNAAISRKIPLVSAKWVENCRLSNKILDPLDYPPMNIEKYTKKQPINFNHLKFQKFRTFKKNLRPSDFERDEQLKLKYESFMRHIKQFSIDYSSQNPKEDCLTLDNSKTIKEPVDPFNIHNIIDALSDQLSKVLNTEDNSIPDDQIDKLCIPMSIKTLRKYLTPKGRENKTPVELDSDLVQIEDRLNLNSKARQRLRKLLFPSDKELHNISLDISDVSDFPSPSPQKIRISAPSRLTSKPKQKIVLNEEDKKVLPFKKNVINNENTPQKKTNRNDILTWRIPTILRPKKFRKINDPNPTCSQKSNNNILSRNSSMIFETPKNSLGSPVLLQTITCSGMTKCEIDIIKLCIQNLGTFKYQSKVLPSTTCLITKSQPNRTLNMIFAMAYGCYIISDDWVHESHKIGRWLPHQQYLISNLSEPVKEFQTRRHTFGLFLTFHIFDDAGSIYIADTCQPSAKHLKKLVRVCGGQSTSIETMADVVVGHTPQINNNISEKWILDCITQGLLLNKCQYKLINNIIT